jgi:hypothetical protein
MARVSTNLQTILAAIVARIQAQVTEFNSDSTCFISRFEDTKADPVPVCKVCPDSGQLDRGLWEGGGREQTTFDSAVLIAIDVQSNRDERGHTESALTDSAHGLLPLAEKVLKALNAHDLQSGGDEILRSPLEPLAYSSPVDGDGSTFRMAWKIRVEFDWAMT